VKKPPIGGLCYSPRATNADRGHGYAAHVATFSHDPAGMMCGASISDPWAAEKVFATLAKAPLANCGRNSDLGVVSFISISFARSAWLAFASDDATPLSAVCGTPAGLTGSVFIGL